MATHVFHNPHFNEYDRESHNTLVIPHRPVARVETDDLEQAFRLTQHRRNSWFTNPDVTVMLRSTSVGDILSQNGDLFVVESAGFSDLQREAPDRDGLVQEAYQVAHAALRRGAATNGELRRLAYLLAQAIETAE